MNNQKVLWSQEFSVQRQDYKMVDESNMQSGDLGNQRSPNEETTIQHSAETIACKGYSSLKRSSFTQPPVYAQLHLYVNTSDCDS